MTHTRAPQLDEGNSDLYLSRPDNVKTCYLNPNPAEYRLSWGTQSFDGPHVLIVVAPPGGEKDDRDLASMEIYGCDMETFHATHLPVPKVENGWYKVAKVRATQVDEPTEIVTVVHGEVESKAVVPPGHWIVQNPTGEQYYNSPEIFARNYVPASEKA